MKKFFTHRSASFAKSGIRLAGYGLIVIYTESALVFLAFGLLAVAEAIGIVEEFLV